MSTEMTKNINNQTNDSKVLTSNTKNMTKIKYSDRQFPAIKLVCSS